MNKAAVEFKNLTLGYNRHPAVHHLDGSLTCGSLTALIGPNGGGKTTLIKALIGRLPPLDGKIEVNLSPIGYIPQLTDLDRSFPISVYEFVLTGFVSRVGIFGRIGRKEQDLAQDCLQRVGLTGLEKRAIRTLSGGQMQRMLFARLMVQEAALIILDEPFAAIDESTIADLLVIISDWHREGRTLLVSLHDLDLVRKFFPQTLLLARETICWGATFEVMKPDHLARAYHYIGAFQQDAAPCAREPLGEPHGAL